MVRRLKEDLRGELGIKGYPEAQGRPDRPGVGRKRRAGRATPITYDRAAAERTRGEPREVGAVELDEGAPVELRLSRMLAEYASLMKPAKGRGKLVFVHLQKRLLSSVPAFYRTLRKHHQRVLEGTAKVRSSATLPLRARGARSVEDDDELGVDDETLDAADEDAVAAATEALRPPEERAAELLDAMLRLAEAHQRTPDAKALALLDWIRAHQCEAAVPGGTSSPKKRERRWTGTRVLIFTEYGDTRRYLVDLLQAAFRDTDRAEERIAQLYGGMNEDARAEVQRSFNAPPDDEPVRVLVATDAAREGINLQGHCADLFHFDVPWNPGRLEQRNGRIDRTLQPAEEVRCHYFRYADRAEDLVLERLVDKVDVIQRELGSLGAVIMDRVEATLADGIDERTSEQLELATRPDGRASVESELEAQRSEASRLRAEIEEAAEIHARSAEVMEFRRDLLRDALDVGLELAGIGPLSEEGDGVFRLPRDAAVLGAHPRPPPPAALEGRALLGVARSARRSRWSSSRRRA